MGSHPLYVFFGLTFLFSWAFWIPSAVLFVDAADADALVTSPLFVALQTLGAAGPSIVALALTRTLEGKAGLRRLAVRFKPARHLAGWYVVAATVAPAITSLPWGWTPSPSEGHS